MLNIPVLIDDVKDIDGFQMTRCTYFTIECDVPAPGWTLGLQDRRVPFYLLGLSGIIYSPSDEEPEFLSPKHISDLFNTIENHPSLYVDTNDIWLPNLLFSKGYHKRGLVYRVGGKLFDQAYRYRLNQISTERFSAWCSDLPEVTRHDICYPSGKEIEAFVEWSRLQIAQAKDIYPKNSNFALQWRQEEDKQK